MIIGVSERGSQWSLDGVNPAHLTTYDIDILIDQVHSYVSARVGLSVVTHTKDGKTFLVIAIHEFDSDTVICS